MSNKYVFLATGVERSTDCLDDCIWIECFFIELPRIPQGLKALGYSGPNPYYSIMNKPQMIEFVQQFID